MRDAPLPGAPAEDLAHGGDEARVGVGDDEPHAREPAGPEPLEEPPPGLPGLRVDALGPEEALAAVGVQAYRRDEGLRDVAAVDLALHVGRVEPHVGRVALDRPRPEGRRGLVELRAEPGDLGARQ